MMQRDGGESTEFAPARREAEVHRPTHRESFRIGQFLREVRSELRQVVWPNRAEVINYTVVTFATLLLLIGLIFVLNLAFAKGVFWLFKT